VARGDVGCIFGAPGAGKSLLAPFLGYMVASGNEAFGMRTKAGPVFYVAAEDPHGMRGRVKALKLAHGDAPGFTLVEGVSDLLRAESADLVALEAAVKERSPALIIVDTLATAFPGLEENSAEAMGRVVAVARRLAEGGAAVVLIHHDTKAEGATPRGHSLLNGALDVALHVKRDSESGIIRGTLTKNRNGQCDRDIAFNIATEDGGTDEDGDKISLPRCNPITAPRGQREKRLSPSALAALAVLSKLGTPSEDEWRQACIDGRTVSASEEVKSRQTAFRRAVADLVRSERVLFQWGRYYENDGFDAMVDLVASSQGDRQRQTSDMSPLVATGKAAVMATDSDIYPLGYVAMSPPDAPQSPLELSEWAGMI
jgi:KaiC/GvpD/RAD55 family RecA-like ATPase